MQNTSKKAMQRVVTFLNRSEVDFLDKLGKDALFSTGLKLSRTKLIAWLIDFAEKLKISGNGIKSEKDLENRIINLLKISAVEQMRHLPTSPVKYHQNHHGSQISNGASHGWK